MEELTEQITCLPGMAGVYFFYDDKDELIYIGKSINIKKRVQQHFTGKDRKSLKIQQTTQRISYEVTGSELIALLHESDMIKKYQPLYNRSQRRTVVQYGLYLGQFNAYKALVIKKVTEGENEITTFSTFRQARESLFRITEKYGLCQKINGLYTTKGCCFGYHIKSCKGACIEVEAPESYNLRVDTFINTFLFKNFTRLFEIPGRDEKEKGLVYINNGVYKGFGYCPVNTNKTDLLKYIDTKADNKDVRRILMSYLIHSS